MDLINFLFPRKCLGCKSTKNYICSTCLQKVKEGKILNEKDFKIYSLFRYEGVIRKAIISLKYKFATDISDELSNVCVNKLKEFKFLKNRNFTLIPIPLYIKRENWRGFNQTEVIGEKIALKIKWKFSKDLLIRLKNTNSQVGLVKNERTKNLFNAFVVNKNTKLSKKLNIILFDDVYTTGSTINEAVKALKSFGYNKITCLVIGT